MKYEVDFHYYMYFYKSVCACKSKNQLEAAHSTGKIILLGNIIPRLFI